LTDRQIKCVARGFRNGLLDGGPSRLMCGAVSFALCGYLSFLGVETELYESDLGDCNHIFLMLSDGRVLDATADQFNVFPGKRYPDVYLGTGMDIHKDAKVFRSRLTATNWKSKMSDPLLPIECPGAERSVGMCVREPGCVGARRRGHGGKVGSVTRETIYAYQ